MKHHSGIFVTGIFLKGKKTILSFQRKKFLRKMDEHLNSKSPKDKIRQIKRLGKTDCFHLAG